MYTPRLLLRPEKNKIRILRTSSPNISINASQGVDQILISLGAWPNLVFTLQGADGSPVNLTVTPGNYWQFDAGNKGVAVANMYGDNGSLGGQSILGLPLFNGYYTVFDRTAASGQGVINFATRT